jgi:hypothetical protein
MRHCNLLLKVMQIFLVCTVAATFSVVVARSAKAQTAFLSHSILTQKEGLLYQCQFSHKASLTMRIKQWLKINRTL